MKLKVIISTVNDGSMKSPDQDFAAVLPARQKFLAQHGLQTANTTLVRLTYDGNDYCRYATLTDSARGDGITRPSTIESDALVVTQLGHALFLPVADCIGAVIHDTQNNILMLSHLGRHNLEQFGGTKCIEYLVSKHGANPKDLTIWLSPAAGKESYPLYAFDNRSLHDVATEQLQQAGVPRTHITVSPIDSAADERYFSHSQYLKQKRSTDGRFAVAAALHSH